MFTCFDLQKRVRTGARVLTLAISMAAHGAGLLGIVVLPLVFLAVPEGDLLTFLLEPPLPPPAKPVPAPPRHMEVRAAAPKAVAVCLDCEPGHVPDHIETVDVALPPVDVPVGIGAYAPAEGPAAAFEWAWTGLPETEKPELPAPPPPVRNKPPLRIGGSVQQSKLIGRVDPAYPALAAKARVSGTVVLEVVVGEEGDVTDVKVSSGHPLLTGAAVEAVRQWRYSPTLLNGEPVAVLATVTVVFNLRP